MNNKSTYDKIESYLLQQMTEAERADFEAELLVDKDLVRQLEQQRLEHKMMEALVEKDLLQDLKKWQKEDEAQTNTKVNNVRQIPFYRRRFIIGIAATFLLLIAALYWFNKDEKTNNSIVDVKTDSLDQKQEVDPSINLDLKEKENTKLAEEDKTKDPSQNPNIKIEESVEPNYIALADSYFEPYDFNKSTVVRGDEGLLEEAIDSIKANNYDLGIEKLSILVKSDSTNLNSLYYLGLAFYNQKKVDQAVPLFEKITESKKGYLYIEDVEWKLGLSLLQIQKIDEAKDILITISKDDEHYYNNLAISLLGKMGN